MGKGKKFHLNRERKKFLGVCAGIADYLEVEPWSVRLVFLAALFMGAWFLVPLYFILYFCLDNDGKAFRENRTIKHLRNVDYRKKLYRNPREGKFLGVCAGLADYFEVDVTLIRIAVLVLLFVAGPIPWFAYFGAWFLLDPKPVDPYGRREERAERFAGEADPAGEEHDEAGAGFAGQREAQGVVHPGGEGRRGRRRWDPDEGPAKRRDFRRCARKFSILQDRLSRMEAYVTSPQYKLNREFKNIS